jgi:hypothetical protein
VQSNPAASKDQKSRVMPDPVGLLRETASGNAAVVKQIGDANARALFWR